MAVVAAPATKRRQTPARRKPTTGEIVIAHGAGCDATDHSVAWGPLGDAATNETEGVACGFGVDGTARIEPGAGSRWLVVVGRTDQAEGSYGRDVFGFERPPRAETDPCDVPQDLGARCE